MDKKLVGLMLIFMLSFGLFTAVIVFNKPLTNLTKAKEELIVSSNSSLIFAWPLSAKADGKYTVQVNVFVRNATNSPLANKSVRLTTNLGKLKQNDIATDQAGKTTFMLGSDFPGLANITALVDNQIQLKANVTVKFE